MAEREIGRAVDNKRIIVDGLDGVVAQGEDIVAHGDGILREVEGGAEHIHVDTGGVELQPAVERG